jgi:hypothetical protein
MDLFGMGMVAPRHIRSALVRRRIEAFFRALENLAGPQQNDLGGLGADEAILYTRRCDLAEPAAHAIIAMAEKQKAEIRSVSRLSAFELRPTDD